MKFQSAALLFAAITEAVPQLGGFGATWPLVGTKQVTPKYRQNAKRVILSYGPITLYGKDVSLLARCCLQSNLMSV